MIQVGGAGGESINLNPEPLKNRDVEIAERPPVPTPALEAVVFPVLEATTGDHDGQIAAGVRAGIAHAAAEHHHRRIKKRSTLGIMNRLEPIKETRELLRVVGLDDGQLSEQVRTLAVMGE